MKVIQFKNKKLCERLEQRQAMEDELREKIEKLEKRQATDDTTLLIVNRYWSQVYICVCCIQLMRINELKCNIRSCLKHQLLTLFMNNNI